MDPQEVRELIENTAFSGEKINTIRKGLQIFEKYIKDVDICAEHDEIYVGGDFDTITLKMTEEDVRELARLGWFVQEDSWAHFT